MKLIMHAQDPTWWVSPAGATALAYGSVVGCYHLHWLGLLT